MSKKPPLTAKKRRWAKRTKANTCARGTVLRQPVGIQVTYQKELRKLFKEIIADTEKEVMKLYKTKEAKDYFAEDASLASIAKKNMSSFVRSINKMMKGKVDKMVDKMITDTDTASSAHMKTSLKELSGGLTINTAVQTKNVANILASSIDANVNLITTIADDYLSHVKGSVSRSIQGGGGLESLIPDMEQFLGHEADMTLNKAKNVSLDQTRKAYNSLNAAKMKDSGLDKFEWIHSRSGQRPRKYHMDKWPEGLNGGIFSLNDLPIIDKKTGETGIPGQAINCKCSFRPLISFDDGEAS